MSIKNQDFTGAESPKYETCIDRARAQMNSWRLENSEIRLISVESLYSDHPSTMTSSGGRSFIALRLWFET